jgi:hypothetical protein
MERLNGLRTAPESRRLTEKWQTEKWAPNISVMFIRDGQKPKIERRERKRNKL